MDSSPSTTSNTEISRLVQQLDNTHKMKQLAPNLFARAILDAGRKTTIVRIVSPGAVCPGFWVVEDAANQQLSVFHSNLMPIENIPNRFRRTTFDRYAHIIGAALSAYPGAVKVDPSPLQVDSYVQPLRDAIAAKKRYGYTHPLIDDVAFARNCDHLVVRSGEGQVFIGSGEATRTRKAVTIGRVADTSAPTLLHETIVSLEHLENTCLLLHQRAFSPQPTFVTIGVAPERILDLENRYDVAFAPHETEPKKHFLLGPLQLTSTNDIRK